MQEIRPLSSFLTPPPAGASSRARQEDESFGDLLSRELGDGSVPDGTAVRFSKHAMLRLETRNITLGQRQMQRLSSAVDRASEKGVSDSLVVMDNLAFIVSVPGRTVVTAMPVDEANSHVFTQIDGAVIL
jgi:flagellar operon protein